MTDPSITTVPAVDPATLEEWELSAISEWCVSARANGGDPTSVLEVKECGLFLKGEAAKHYGPDLPCLAVYQDDLGNWSALIRRPGDVGIALSTLQFIGDTEVG